MALPINRQPSSSSIAGMAMDARAWAVENGPLLPLSALETTVASDTNKDLTSELQLKSASATGTLVTSPTFAAYAGGATLETDVVSLKQALCAVYRSLRFSDASGDFISDGIFNGSLVKTALLTARFLPHIRV